MNRNYQDYFRVGQTARVELMLEDDRRYTDRGVITGMDGHQLAVRLSRDTLPEGATRRAPAVVRVGGEGSGYRCRGVVLGGEPEEDLLLGLVEGVVPEDLREYFRLSTEMPVTLHHLPSGAEECSIGGARYGSGDYLPRITNISGGGLRTETTLKMGCGDLVQVRFHLPLPEPKTVPALARVVQCQEREEGDGRRFSAGLAYHQIGERDRDAVVAYVCNEEIKRIQRCRKHFLSLPED